MMDKDLQLVDCLDDLMKGIAIFEYSRLSHVDGHLENEIMSDKWGVQICETRDSSLRDTCG